MSDPVPAPSPDTLFVANDCGSTLKTLFLISFLIITPFHQTLRGENQIMDAPVPSNDALFVANYSGRTLKTLQSLDLPPLLDAMAAVRKTLKSGGTIFVCGNGGSSAIASHFVGDIVKCVAEKNPDFPCRAICLSDSIPTLTATANDNSYSYVFMPPLKALVKPGDLLIAISGSGNSPNVLNAIRFLKTFCPIPVIGLTSAKQGELRTLCDLPVLVNETNMATLEDFFQIYLHIIAYSLMETPL